MAQEASRWDWFLDSDPPPGVPENGYEIFTQRDKALLDGDGEPFPGVVARAYDANGTCYTSRPIGAAYDVGEHSLHAKGKETATQKNDHNARGQSTGHTSGRRSIPTIGGSLSLMPSAAASQAPGHVALDTATLRAGPRTTSSTTAAPAKLKRLGTSQAGPTPGAWSAKWTTQPNAPNPPSIGSNARNFLQMIKDLEATFAQIPPRTPGQHSAPRKTINVVSSRKHPTELRGDFLENTVAQGRSGGDTYSEMAQPTETRLSASIDIASSSSQGPNQQWSPLRSVAARTEYNANSASQKTSGSNITQPTFHAETISKPSGTASMGKTLDGLLAQNYSSGDMTNRTVLSAAAKKKDNWVNPFLPAASTTNKGSRVRPLLDSVRDRTAVRASTASAGDQPTYRIDDAEFNRSVPSATPVLDQGSMFDEATLTPQRASFRGSGLPGHSSLRQSSNSLLAQDITKPRPQPHTGSVLPSLQMSSRGLDTFLATGSKQTSSLKQALAFEALQASAVTPASGTIDDLGSSSHTPGMRPFEPNNSLSPMQQSIEPPLPRAADSFILPTAPTSAIGYKDSWSGAGGRERPVWPSLPPPDSDHDLARQRFVHDLREARTKHRHLGTAVGTSSESQSGIQQGDDTLRDMSIPLEIIGAFPGSAAGRNISGHEVEEVEVDALSFEEERPEQLYANPEQRPQDDTHLQQQCLAMQQSSDPADDLFEKFGEVGQGLIDVFGLRRLFGQNTGGWQDDD